MGLTLQPYTFALCLLADSAANRSVIQCEKTSVLESNLIKEAVSPMHSAAALSRRVYTFAH